MKLNNEGVKLIMDFEGCALKSYQDIGGVWTIGYGHIVGVKPDMILTLDEARQLLNQDLHMVVHSVEMMVSTPINDNQFSSLVSFAYNLGVFALKGSALLVKINQNDLLGAANEFLKWDHVKGKKVPGLTRRREAERSLFLKSEVV